MASNGYILYCYLKSIVSRIVGQGTICISRYVLGNSIAIIVFLGDNPQVGVHIILLFFLFNLYL